MSASTFHQLRVKASNAARDLESYCERRYLEDQIILLEQTQVAESLKCILGCKMVGADCVETLHSVLDKPKKKLKTGLAPSRVPQGRQTLTDYTAPSPTQQMEQEIPDLQRVGLL